VGIGRELRGGKESGCAAYGGNSHLNSTLHTQHSTLYTQYSTLNLRHGWHECVDFVQNVCEQCANYYLLFSVFAARESAEKKFLTGRRECDKLNTINELQLRARAIFA
jgi:hypothetical protein